MLVPVTFSKYIRFSPRSYRSWLAVRRWSSGVPQYPGLVTSRSMATERVLGMIAAHRGRIDSLLARYGARNPQVFGSVARGDASQISDLDLLVVLDPSGGNPLLRVAGLAEELSELLQMRVDVVADELLKAAVSASAHADAVPL